MASAPGMRYLLAATVVACVGVAACSAVTNGHPSTTGIEPHFSAPAGAVPVCDDACLSSYAQYKATAPPLGPPGPSTGPVVGYTPASALTTTSVAAGKTLTFTDPDTAGSFDIAVSKPIAVILTSGEVGLTMGALVTITNVAGGPELVPSDLGIGSANGVLTDADDGNEVGDDDPSTARTNSAACKGKQLLYDALEDAGLDDPDGTDSFDLTGIATQTVTGCVVFNYDSGERPNAIALFDDDPGINDSAIVVLSRAIKAPKQTTLR